MAVIENGQISGLIGPVVAVRNGKKLILRSVPRKRDPKKRTRNQLQHNNRFSELVRFWNQFRYSPVQKIWKLADEGGRGINLFIKTNLPAFDVAGQLADPSRLHLSAGKLPLPHRLTAVKDQDPSKLLVSWDNTPEPGFGRDDDQLMFITSKQGFYSPLQNTDIERQARNAVITLPEGTESVYLFFGSEKRALYSEDMNFR